MTRSSWILGIALAALAASGCSSDPPPDVRGERFVEHDSCGDSFIIRDVDGTVRLTIDASPEVAEGSEPGVFDISADGWSGHLEVGSGLVVWPCHDIGSDFDDENVREIWPILSGTIELLDPVVADTDGGGTDPVRARIHRVVLESSDGSAVTLEDIAVANPRWGFAGG